MDAAKPIRNMLKNICAMNKALFCMKAEDCLDTMLV